MLLQQLVGREWLIKLYFHTLIVMQKNKAEGLKRVIKPTLMSRNNTAVSELNEWVCDKIISVWTCISIDENSMLANNIKHKELWHIKRYLMEIRFVGIWHAVVSTQNDSFECILGILIHFMSLIYKALFIQFKIKKIRVISEPKFKIITGFARQLL